MSNWLTYLVNHPLRKPKALVVIVGVNIVLHHTQAHRGMDKLNLAFAPAFGNQPDMGNLFLFLTRSKENKITRFQFFQFNLLAHLALTFGTSGQLNLYRPK